MIFSLSLSSLLLLALLTALPDSTDRRVRFSTRRNRPAKSTRPSPGGGVLCSHDPAEDGKCTFARKAQIRKKKGGSPPGICLVNSSLEQKLLDQGENQTIRISTSAFPLDILHSMDSTSCHGLIHYWSDPFVRTTTSTSTYEHQCNIPDISGKDIYLAITPGDSASVPTCQASSAPLLD